MKATPEQQQQQIFDGFDHILNQRGYHHNDLLASRLPVADCWRLFTLWLQYWARHNDRPVGYGTDRDYLFPTLDDTHLETVFRKYLKRIDNK